MQFRTVSCSFPSDIYIKLLTDKLHYMRRQHPCRRWHTHFCEFFLEGSTPVHQCPDSNPCTLRKLRFRHWLHKFFFNTNYTNLHEFFILTKTIKNPCQGHKSCQTFVVFQVLYPLWASSQVYIPWTSTPSCVRLCPCQAKTPVSLKLEKHFCLFTTNGVK